MTAGAFLYFVPDLSKPQVTREWLRSSPLCEVLRDVWERSEGWRLLHITECNRGPNGQRGILLAANPCDEQGAFYVEDQQDWRDVGSHWIGIDRRYKPTAESLRRRRLVPGIEVELATGGVWVLPIIRKPNSETVLPSMPCIPLVQTSGRGVPAARIPERYQGIWELTGRLFNWYFLSVPLTDTKADSASVLYDAAAVCLGVNYRVGPHELDSLECLEDDDVTEIIRAAIDADTVDEIVKARERTPDENPLTAPG